VVGVNLTVGSGEIFCLLGGSGSGKTTLLPPHRGDVTTLFQSYALFPHMNVADNIGFGLRRRGMTGAAATLVLAALVGLLVAGTAIRRLIRF
jgi:spermidine/putrescine transport system ATP-binding protein